jgi:hypothetical protein
MVQMLIYNKHLLNFIFYVVSTVHFEMKLYNNQRNARFFKIYLFICFCLSCFGLFLSPSSRGTVYKLGSGPSLLGVSVRARLEGARR